MPEDDPTLPSKRLGRIVSIAIIAAAVISALLLIAETNRYPRTDDAEVFANYIGIAPQVDGPITRLAVQDNAFIKQGELLFEIDPRPYEYALQKATAAANVDRAASAVNEAKANVASAKAALDNANAELTYTTNNYHRIEPLLARQFVTVDQVDLAKTAVTSKQQAVSQQHAQLTLAEAQVQSAQAQYEQAKAVVEQSHAQLGQSQHSVLTIDPLTAQREGRASAIRTAQYNLDNCKIYSPFDARVTNLNISQGAYAHTGQQIFTLIDTRVWWVIANFRETQLHRIQPGMHADVYVLSRPGVRYDGIVDSVGFGVQPDSTLIGTFTSNGLPDVQRSLNWVHLATRFPVRIRIKAPESEAFRLSESAAVVIRGYDKAK
jgi:multidrug efflux system membrane fusion protein